MENTSENRNLNIKICTLNVRGLTDKKKRLGVINWFKNEKIDILCLQETFCTENNKTTFNKEWDHVSDNIHHCVTNSVHSRGVCVIFKNTLSVDIENIKQSNDGRRLLINAKINKTTL